MTQDALETKKSMIFYGAYDSFVDLQQYQEPEDRKYYMETVCEAMSTNSGKAAMLQKLYNDIQGKSTMDTALIDQTRGIFTKFKGYKSTMNAIEILEDLYAAENDAMVGGHKKDIALIRSLIDNLTMYRKSFEDGYRISDFTIMSFYRITVLNILEMINVCTVNYMLTVRGKAGENGVKPGEFRKIRSNSEQNLKAFQNGDFMKVAKTITKGKVAPGTEALGDTAIVRGAVGFMTSGVPAFAKIFVGGAAAIMALFAVFHAIRVAIYYFFSANAKLESWLTTQSELIKYNAEQDRLDPNSEKKEQQVRKMQSMARFIRVKILKTENEAEKIESVEAKSTYSAPQINTVVNNNTEVDPFSPNTEAEILF